MKRMISYAQNGEDVLLNRLFAPDVKGFYVDIGANDPVRNSVTKHFYDRGWRGINVEPALAPFQMLIEQRPRDVNLNIGVSNAAGTLTLYETPPGTGASTFAPEFAARLGDVGITASERPVPVLTLAQIFTDYVDAEIDFLTIDVEGYESQVLAGGDWHRWRPRVVVVEATEPQTTKPSHESWESTLLDANYLFATFDGLNRYYVREEDSEMVSALQTPTNVFDRFDPYVYVRSVDDKSPEMEWSYGRMVAVRVINDTLWHEYHALLADYNGLEPQLSTLQAEFERLLRALANTRTHQLQMKTAVDDALARYWPLCSALSEATARAEEATACADEAIALLGAVSPAALGIARRLTRLSGRFPNAARTCTGIARLLLALKRRTARVAAG